MNRLYKLLFSTVSVFFIFLLCVLFCLSGTAQDATTGVYSKAPNYTNFTSSQIAKKSDKQFVEVVSKRTIDSRYFIAENDPSVFCIEKSLGAIHYKKDNQWQRINAALSPKGNNIFEASDQLEPVGFNATEKRAYIKTVYGEVAFNSWQLFGKKGGSEILLSNANWSNYTVGDEGLYIFNIFPGMDAEFRVFKGAVKTSFIITKNNFPGYGSFIFKDVFSTDNSTAQLNSASNKFEEADYIIDKKTALHIGRNFAYATIDPSKTIKNISYKLNKNELSFDIDAAYINQYLSSGKVIIDPLVSAITSIAPEDIKASRNNGSFATACTYPINIEAPAQATFTSVSFQFTMYSKAPATNAQIFWAITNGSCVSGNWTCASTANCTLDGTVGTLGNYVNISSSMLSCLPPPSCTKQNVPYVLRMWNRYTGATSICDTTYVGAREPFIIRMEGRTVEVGTISSSVPSLSICAGTPVNLTATGIYGVTPYAFAWDKVAGNTATVTVQPTATTTYNVTVTDRCNVTATKPITITVTPGNTPSPVASNNGPFCENTSSSLNLTATVVSGATYKWTGPNGFTSTSRNPIINTVSLAQAGTYSVVAIVGNCQSVAASTIVVVNPIPVITNATSDAPRCVGQSVNLSTPAISGATFTWTGPNSFTSNDRLAVIPNATTAVSGTYSVTATANGCLSAPFNNVVVNVYSVPVVTGAGNSGPVCAGQSINLTTPNNPGVVFNWSGPNGFTSSDQNPVIPITTVNAAGLYTVTATANFCTSAPQSTTVLINPSPVIGTVSANGPLCKGQTINLSTSTIAGAIFNWTGTNGFTSTDQNPSIPNADIVHSGIYSVTATANNCTSLPKTVSVTVTAIPNISSVNNNGPVCEGKQILLTTPDIAGATFAWSGPNGFTSNQQNPVINSAVAANAGVYSMTATINGCTSSPATTTVAINSTPIVGPITSNSPLCNGAALSLTLPNVAGAIFTWTGPNGFTSNDQNISIPTATATNAGSYSVTARGTNGCISAPVNTNVLVGVSPVTNFGASTACLPNTLVQFSDSSVISEGSIVSYQWNFGDPLSGAANTSLSVSPQHTFSSASSFTVSLTTKSDKGCSHTKTLTYNGFMPQPLAVFSMNDAAVCLNDKILFTNRSITPTGTIQSSTWSFGNGSIADQPDISTILSRSFSTSGRFPVTLTVTNTGGCKDDTTQFVDISPLPVINAGNNIVLFAGESRKLSITGESADLTYLWSPSDFLNSTVIAEPTISGITRDMLYQLVATSSGGCSTTDSISVKLLQPILVPNTFTPNNDGINDLWLIENLQTYPNASVEIFNRYGQLLYESKGIYKPWDGTYKGKPLPFGTYYYIIDTDGTVSTLTGYVSIIK